MRIFDKNLLEILGCPKCKQKLRLDDAKLLCDLCNMQYPIIEGIPVLHMRNKLYDEKYYKDGRIIHKKGKRSPLMKFVRFITKRATPSCRTLSNKSRDMILSCLKNDSAKGSRKVIVNIGPAKTRQMKNLLKECGPVLKLCIDLEETADIVGDIRYMPFQENTVDFELVIAVLEHVDEPNKAVEEINKTLKPNGKVYVEIPFCRSYHPMPCDFQRYTISGIEKLFENFRCIEKGVASGPGSAMSLALSSFCAILLSFGNLTWYKFLNRIFRMITKPIQYVDFICQRNKLAHRFACALYILCEKNA